MTSIYDWWVISRTFDDGFTSTNLALYQIKAYDECLKKEQA